MLMYVNRNLGPGQDIKALSSLVLSYKLSYNETGFVKEEKIYFIFVITIKTLFAFKKKSYV